MGISTIATAASGAATGGMSPILLSALLETGGGLLKGLFGGMGRNAEDKREWEKFMKKYGLYQERMKQLKPTQPYSRGIDPVTEQAIMNMFRQRGMQVPQYTGLGEGGQ